MTDAATAADLMFRPASELADLVRDGEITARELVEASLSRIDALNPVYNAFIDVFHEEALLAADGVKPGDERPLAGVPIAIKNNRPVEGKRFTFASSFFGDFIAPFDWIGVTRLREAGAIIVGTTNLPEFGIVPTTEPRRFGATRNPWDPTRTTGRLVRRRGGGGRRGHDPDRPRQRRRRLDAHPGRVLRARRAQGAARADQRRARSSATRSSASTASSRARRATPPWRSTCSPATRSATSPGPRRRRIAVRDAGGRGAARAADRDDDAHAGRRRPVDPRVQEALDEAAALLRDLGHEVIEDDPPWRIPGLLEQFGALWAPMISTQTAFGAQIAGREPTLEDIEPLTLALYQAAKGIDATTYLGVEMMLQGVARAIVQWTAQYDVVLCPTLAELPVPLGTIDTCDEANPMSGFDARGGVHAVHGGREPHRLAGDQRPARPRRRTRAADRRPAHRPARGRGHAARAQPAARGRAAVGRRRAPVDGA